MGRERGCTLFEKEISWMKGKTMENLRLFQSVRSREQKNVSGR